MNNETAVTLRSSQTRNERGSLRRARWTAPFWQTSLTWCWSLQISHRSN